jgi:hypothetical protein
MAVQDTENVFTIAFPFKGDDVPLGISIAMRVQDVNGAMNKFAVVSENPHCYDCTVGDVIVAVDGVMIQDSNPNPLKTISKLIKDKRTKSEDVILSFRRGFSSLLSTPPPKKNRRKLSLVEKHSDNNIDMIRSKETSSDHLSHHEHTKEVDTSNMDIEMRMQLQNAKARHIEMFANEVDVIMNNYERRLQKMYAEHPSPSLPIQQKLCSALSSLKETKSSNNNNNNETLQLKSTNRAADQFTDDSDDIMIEKQIIATGTAFKNEEIEENNKHQTPVANVNDGGSLMTSQLLLVVGGIIALGLYASSYPLKSLIQRQR